MDVMMFMGMSLYPVRRRAHLKKPSAFMQAVFIIGFLSFPLRGGMRIVFQLIK